MTDKLTPMEAEVLEMPVKAAEPCPATDSYGTATPPKPKRSFLGLWILLGVTVIILSTCGVMAHFFRTGSVRQRRVQPTENAVTWDLSLWEQTGEEQGEKTWKGNYHPGIRVDSTSGREEPLTASEIYEKAAPSVVCVTMSSLYYSWNCSGIILSQDGFILCATDVSPDYASQVSVTLHDGTDYPAYWVAMDPVTNICVLKIDEKNLSVAQFAPEDSVEVGQTVYCIASPYGPEVNNVLFQGMVSLKRPVSVNGEDCVLLQSSAGVEGGYGAPLLDSYGRVLGMTTAVAPQLVDTSADPCFALGASYLQAVLDCITTEE